MSAFLDARSDAVGERLHAPVVIVGAGAAGITLARELAAKGQRVLLIESGGEKIEGKTQGLYVAPNTGSPYYDLASCRLRYFGGTTNHWSGYCRANDPIDYEGRPALGLPRWPVSHEELAPYIAQAATLLEIDSQFFDPEAQLKARGLTDVELLEKQAPALETKNFQLAQNIHFNGRFRPEIAGSPLIQPVEYLNIVEVVLDGSGRRVSHLTGVTLDGKQVRVDGNRFVLCCHAIENARLLLASDKQAAGGIGNANGHVGRYFMEHPYLFASRFIPSDRFPQLYNRSFLDRYHLNANISLSEAAMREHGVMSYYCRFNPVDIDPTARSAAGRVRRNFWEPASTDLFRDVALAMSDLPGIAAFVTKSDQPRFFALEHRIEQAPNPNSRVKLTAKTDKLGMREIELDWQFTDLDVKTLNIGQKIVAQELSALQMGRFEIEEIDMDMMRERALGHYHHIGTTRMSADPADGVVDPNQKVHGVDNLYIAGSSVFPSAGYSGPTMMIVGMTMRLAEHLTGATA